MTNFCRKNIFTKSNIYDIMYSIYMKSISHKEDENYESEYESTFESL